MFFYESCLILDHYQVPFIEISQEHLQFSKANLCSNFVFSFHYMHTYCFRFIPKDCQSTFTVRISFPLSCLTWESNILTSPTPNIKSSRTWTSSSSNTCIGLAMYFLNYDTWKTYASLPSAMVKWSHRLLDLSSVLFDMVRWISEFASWVWSLFHYR